MPTHTTNIRIFMINVLYSSSDVCFCFMFPQTKYEYYDLLLLRQNNALFYLSIWSPKCAAITGVGVDMSPHCFIKGPNGSASYTASGSKV